MEFNKIDRHKAMVMLADGEDEDLYFLDGSHGELLKFSRFSWNSKELSETEFYKKEEL